MAFLVEADVEAELSYDISASTQPTSTELTAFITQAEAVVSGVLHSVKINPDAVLLASTPDSYYVVQSLVLWYTCSRVIAAAGGLIRAQPDKEKNYWSRFSEMVEQIKETPNICGPDTPFYTSDSDMIWPAGITSSHDDYYEEEFAMDEEW